METRKFTQFGILQVIIFGVLLTLFISKLFSTGFGGNSVLTFVGLSLLMLSCLLTFYRIVIEVDEKQISFKLGVGLFKRTYPIHELKSCAPVRSSFLSGFGIRRIANGWLYNIYGLDAIELRFENTRNIVRIGTNKSVEIASLVSRFINPTQGTNDPSQFEDDSRNWRYWKNWISVVVVLSAILYFLFITKNDAITADTDHLKISGTYSRSIDYSQIIKIDTISTMPEMEERTNGSFFRNQAKGYFISKEVGSAYLNVNLNYPPFIRIVLKDDGYVFLNLCDPKETTVLFKNIQTQTLNNKSL